MGGGAEKIGKDRARVREGWSYHSMFCFEILML